MTEPRRWLDGGEDAPAGARELLEHAPRSQAIDKAALAASAAALAKLGATPAVAAAAAFSLPIKLVASVALVAVAGVATVELARTPVPEAASLRARAPYVQSATPAPRSTTQPQPALVVEPAPLAAIPPSEAAAPRPRGRAKPSFAASAATAEAPSAKPVTDVAQAPANAPVAATAAPQAAPEVTPTAPEPATVPAPEPAPAPELDALAAEVRWLEHARALLPSDPGTALRQASEHRTRFPQGSLVAERELIAVEALERLGRHAEAERRGKALLARFPGSLYRERLRSLFRK